MNNEQKPRNHLVERALDALKKEYVVVGKTHVRAWHVWLIIGLLTGITAGIVFVANRSGEFEPTKAAQLIQQQVVLSGLRNLYAPSVLAFQGIKRMWTGGWLTEADVGPDKIYYAEFSDSWQILRDFTFAKSGFHVNDPTVINPPNTDGINRSAWLYMYYTALSNSDASAGRLDRHVVGFASSVDSGRTWTDHGIIIPQNNGIDNSGAWAPSAIVRGNEIWVYYNTNKPSPNVIRSKFTLAGWEPVVSRTLGQLSGSTEFVSLIENTDIGWVNKGAVVGVNVDISWQDPWLVMLINDAPSHTVSRFISHPETNQGLKWFKHPQDVNPIINGGSNFFVTPHAETIDWNRYKIYFGFSTTDNSHFDSIHAWEFKSF